MRWSAMSSRNGDVPTRSVRHAPAVRASRSSRIAALREAGVTHLHVVPFGSDTPKLFGQVKEWIS